jgi:predicted ATPase/DNA-binding CsgD family transcriptional regulator
VGELAAGPTSDFRRLSHALTSFVGRSIAVDKVTELLSRHRLVTVAGPGGVGKTRLADEVLRRVAHGFADGVCVVELAAIQDQALVPVVVAAALGLREAADVPVSEGLSAHLARRQVLLVLDNCEHVLDAVTQLVASLLLAADDIRILATSREPLGLPGEVRYRLPPLTLPAPDAGTQRGEAEAVTLFVERAREIDPGLTFDADSAAMVERLVRQLDGMPLAIELAAARIEALGLPGLLDRLDDRFRLLASPGRRGAARQQSLEAAVDWSYQLLDEAEQRVFRHLAVFPGPFTLDAAEAVAGADAAPTVLRLVECSLLVPPRTGPDGRSRYLMLETLRSYALSRLSRGGEEPQAASALAGHVLQVAEHAAAQLEARDLEQPAALWLDAEDAALHQGLAWTQEHDHPAALRLAVALAPWWQLRGRWVQGYALLRQAVEQTDTSQELWCAAQLWLGHLSGSADQNIRFGHYSVAAEAFPDGRPSAERVDGLAGQSAVLRNMGLLAEAEAEAAARRALDLGRQINFTAGEAEALKELSCISMYADDGEHAAEWARQARQIDQSRMPEWRVRNIERILAWVLIAAGRPEDLSDASDLCARALDYARTAGDLGAQADVLFLMEVLAQKTGRLPDAREYLRQAAELATQVSSTMRLIDILDEGGFLCTASGQYGEAITLWSAMTVHGRANGLADTVEGQRRRTEPLREAQRALGSVTVKAAEARGSTMTLAAAVDFAVLMTGESLPAPAAALPTPGLLSARERELVALVAQGRTDNEIAEKLFISVSTVRTHLDRIRDKSGFRRRADLTRLALREGIV